MLEWTKKPSSFSTKIGKKLIFRNIFCWSLRDTFQVFTLRKSFQPVFPFFWLQFDLLCFKLLEYIVCRIKLSTRSLYPISIFACLKFGGREHSPLGTLLSTTSLPFDWFWFSSLSTCECHIFSCWVKSNPVKLETSHAGMVGVLCCWYFRIV